MKLFIGTKFRGHDSAVCIVNSDQNDIFCLSTERLTRYKHDSIYPIEVINHYLNERKINPAEVSEVILGNSFESDEYEELHAKEYEFTITSRRFLNANFIKDYNLKRDAFINQSVFIKIWKAISCISGWKLIYLSVLKLFLNKTKMNQEVEKYLKLIFKKAKIKINHYNHHYCHAVSSFYSSDFNEALCITIDGFGDGAFSKVYKFNSETSEELSVSKHESIDLSGQMRSHIEDGSIGGVYTYFTDLLGFRPLSDEGKVEALAAYGDHKNNIFESLMKLFSINEMGEIKLNKDHFKTYLNIDNISKEIASFKREDVAAAVQKWLEEIALEYVKFHVEKTGIKQVCLSGGVAANVIMNLRIFEEITRDIYVVPAMSDEGAAQGAVVILMKEDKRPLNWMKQKKMPYWGTQFSKDDVLKAVESFVNIKQVKLENDWEDEVSKELVHGKIGAIFHGRMEWGPRALGNRSILADPRNKASIDKINNKIKRRESFQPFCPSILVDEAERLFNDYYLNKHMTCAFRMKDEFHSELPGAIHVDGTARVQFVSENDNPSYYKIIKNVKKRNGYGVVLNTSFNMHGRAMVQSPYDAIRDFLDTGMDFLVLEGIMIKRSDKE